MTEEVRDKGCKLLWLIGDFYYTYIYFCFYILYRKLSIVFFFFLTNLRKHYELQMFDFRIYFVLISSHCVNTGSCRSLLGCNKFIHFLRVLLGVLIRPLFCFGSSGAKGFSFSFEYPDAFWTLGSRSRSSDPGTTRKMRIV